MESCNETVQRGPQEMEGFVLDAGTLFSGKNGAAVLVPQMAAVLEQAVKRYPRKLVIFAAGKIAQANVPDAVRSYDVQVLEDDPEWPLSEGDHLRVLLDVALQSFASQGIAPPAVGLFTDSRAAVRFAIEMDYGAVIGMASGSTEEIWMKCFIDLGVRCRDGKCPNPCKCRMRTKLVFSPRDVIF
jgi:hypothetical protein